MGGGGRTALKRSGFETLKTESTSLMDVNVNGHFSMLVSYRIFILYISPLDLSIFFPKKNLSLSLSLCGKAEDSPNMRMCVRVWTRRRWKERSGITRYRTIGTGRALARYWPKYLAAFASRRSDAERGLEMLTYSARLSVNPRVPPANFFFNRFLSLLPSFFSFSLFSLSVFHRSPFYLPFFS